MSLRVILMAAGFGVRFHPLDERTSKALLQLGNKLVIDYLMEGVRRIRPTSVTVVTNNRFYEAFVHWKSKRLFPFPVHVVNNGASSPYEAKNETHDLHQALTKNILIEEDALVLDAEQFFEFPINYFLLEALHHLPHPVVGVHEVKAHEERKRFGVVEFDRDHIVTYFSRKPEASSSNFGHAGVFLIPKGSSALFEEYFSKIKYPDRIEDFIGWICAKQKVLAVPIEGLWKDIGNFDTYHLLSHLLKK